MFDGIVLESHVFNKSRNALQPVDNICMCCGKNLSTGEDDYYQTFYKEESRTNLIVVRNVRFRKIDVGVSRCHECKVFQRNAKIKAIILGYTLGFGIIILTSRAGLLLSSLNEVLGLVTILVGILAGWFLGRLTYKRVKRTICLKHNILPVDEALMSYKLVEMMLDDDWITKKPKA